MSIIRQVNNSLLYLLIFTIISSAIAFHVVVKAYDSVFELNYTGE